MEMKRIDAVEAIGVAHVYAAQNREFAFAENLRQTRDAVRDLIEAADVLTDAITFRIDDPRHALLDRVVKALARVRSS